MLNQKKHQLDLLTGGSVPLTKSPEQLLQDLIKDIPADVLQQFKAEWELKGGKRTH